MAERHAYVLGLNTYDHDVSACLLRDGKIAFAIAKERITREKNASGFYQEVIDYCLNAEGIQLDDVELVVRNCYIMPVEEMEGRLQNHEVPFYLPEKDRARAKQHPLYRASSSKVVTVSHHLAHAYSAFAVSPFDEGVVMVDTGAPGQAAKLQAAVRSLTRKPLRYLINSGPDADHAGGNGEMVTWAGGTSGPQAGNGGGRPPNVGTAVIAHENAYNRLINGSRELPALTGDGLPESTFFTPRKDIFANGAPVQLLHQPNAHTDGDVVVFFRGPDVVAAGDVFRTDRYPMVDIAQIGRAHV